MRWVLPGLLGVLAVAAVGCDDDGVDDDTFIDDTFVDDTGETTYDIAWADETIAAIDAGTQTVLALGPNDAVWVASFGNTPWQDGTCTEVPVAPPPRMRHDLYFAERSSGGVWTSGVVVSPVVAFSPTGLGLVATASGDPAIAYTGGPAQDQYCGANDAVLSTRVGTTWTPVTAAATSGQANTGQPASDSGFVVGLWPAVALDASGLPAVLYRDAHFGSLQHDDQYRADTELSWSTGGGWNHEAVDIGEGAGEYGALAFDDQGRPVAAYAVVVDAQTNPRKGVWASRRDSTGTWERVQLHTGAIHQEVSLVVNQTTGEVLVAFYAASDKAVRLRRLSDPTAFATASAWSSEYVGQAQYDEGQGVSLALTTDGRAAMAYHRCKLVTATSGGCDPNDEAVIFALETDDGWFYDAVEEADQGSCGEFTSLAITSDDIAWIAYRCTVDDGGFAFRPKVSWGEL